MNVKNYIEDQSFVGKAFAQEEIAHTQFENCSFENCSLAGLQLSQSKFIDCRITNSDLSLAKMDHTSLQEVTFTGCKLLGVNFDNCSKLLFSASFENCTLSLASFYGVHMKNSSFVGCNLHEVDFTNTVLTGSWITNCDLLDAVFDNTLLEKVDFRSSFGFIINPDKNYLSKAKFSLNSITGLLANYDILIE